METNIFIYMAFASLGILWFNTGLLEASTDSPPVECNATVSGPDSVDLPEIMVRAEHLYSSVTKGSPYSKGPNPAGDVRLGGNETSGSQTITFAYNGTVVCASGQKRWEYDTCWAGSSTGCFNETNMCDSVCFRAKDFFVRHSLTLFDRKRSSSSIGTWSMTDYVRLYTAPAHQLTCHYSTEIYRHWPNRGTEYPNLTTMKCPIGQRCRITIGQYILPDPMQTFIGCETDSNHFDGCDEGCTWRKYHYAPNGRRENWAHMCKYCCSEDLCNNPLKCKNLNCNLTTVLDTNTESPPNSADSFVCRYCGICIYNLLTFLLVLFCF